MLQLGHVPVARIVGLEYRPTSIYFSYVMNNFLYPSSMISKKPLHLPFLFIFNIPRFEENRGYYPGLNKELPLFTRREFNILKQIPYGHLREQIHLINYEQYYRHDTICLFSCQWFVLNVDLRTQIFFYPYINNMHT